MAARRRGTLILLLAALCAGAAIGIVALSRSGEPESAADLPAKVGPFRGNRLPAGLTGTPAPAFALTEAGGDRLGTQDMAGSPYVVTFLFTDCPDVCPLIAEEIAAGLRMLGPQASAVQVLAVSVDPAGDSPASVARFIRDHRLPSNFHYLIGSESELRPVWDAYYAAPQVAGRPDSSHTASVWLIDARGRIRTKYSGGAPIAPRDLAHDLRILSDEAVER